MSPWPIAAFAALPAGDVRADDASLAQVQGDRVVVTGSRIARTDLEGPLPVQVITRDQIEASGVTTVEQLLERVPANVNPVTTALTIGSADQPGLAAANLRGLGAGSTLVLLNGRRLANYAFNGETVDLNAIPLAAIERVEVLRDGASAIYGTDAIAGVVNFILRSDYRGVEASASVNVTQHGGGNAAQASLTLGTGDPAVDGYNVFGMVGVQRQQALRGRDRESTRTAYRPDLGVVGLSALTYPSNILDRPGFRLLNPTAEAGCSPPSSLPIPTVPPLRPGTMCAFDFAAVADVLPEVERASALLRGTWRAGAETNLYAEAMVARNRFDTAISPYPVAAFTTAFGAPVYPADGPYYPGEFAAANGLAGDLPFSWRATEFGPRLNTTTSEAQRFVLGVDALLGDWDVDAAALYSANEQAVEYGGSYFYLSRLIPALRSGLVNPWGPTGPEGQALLAAAAYRGTPQTANGSTTLLNVAATGELAQLPAGTVAAALGGEARRERLAYEWDPAVLSGDSPIGSALTPVSGSRDVVALFAELNVPIAPRLEAQLALRWDDYSDFGSTTNPKVALRWQPVSSLLLRGSWGQGFRAPPLYTLNEPQDSSDIYFGRDPVRCPATESVDDCFLQVPLTTGGNPALRPETSTQRHVGVVWAPLRALSLGLDAWDIEQKGAVTTVAPEYIVANEEQFPARVSRGPADPETPGLPGPIVAVDATAMNIGTTRTSGVDVDLDWNLPPTDLGRVRISLLGTYVSRYDTQLDGVETVSLLGRSRFFAPAVPRWRSTLNLDWTGGAWSSTLSMLYSRGYVEPVASGFGTATGTREVAAAMQWDLQVRYAGFAGWGLAAGIRNLFDQGPPFSQTSPFQFGFNPQVASPLGRTFYVRLSYAPK
ncbi:MAG: TonB-dependent receptor [Rubrivivax sp.]|nr:TonB-dependent receptor [Rubrivivax sp.]